MVPTRRLLLSSRYPSLSLCSTCLYQLLSKRPNSRVQNFSRTSIRLEKTEEQAHPLSGYYAAVLRQPNSLIHPSLLSRPVTQPPPDSVQSTSASTPTPEETTRTNIGSEDGPTSPPSSDLPAFDPDDPASRARIVFGSRLAGPGRAASRVNLSRNVAGIMVPPRPIEPDNCCMSGCVNCVWDLYREELEDWAVQAAKAKAALEAQAQAEGESKPKKRGRRKKTEEKAGSNEVQSAAGSMDDDGGGSGNSWDAQLLDAGKSQEDLMSNIPVGIREFMRTEKMLKEKHREEAKVAGLSA